jgi:hypothetical protein
MGKFELRLMTPYLETHRTYVETGTLYGNGALSAEPHFDKIYTIELDRKLHKQAKRRFLGHPKIVCLQGDSKEVLVALIPELPPTGVIFFLDAHWSGDHTVDWEKSVWKGHVQSAYVGEKPTSENQVPLLGELEAIVSDYPGNAVIYIDDMDKFDACGNGTTNLKFIGEDWSHLTVQKMKDIVSCRASSWSSVNSEQLVIEIKKKHDKV